MHIAYAPNRIQMIKAARHDQRLQPREVVVGFQGIAAGLCHIHSTGLVDLFAGNVMQNLDSSAWVKADLGKAVPLELGGQLNKVHCSMSSENTESPEMAHSMSEHDWYHAQHSSDIWALGLLMLDVVGGVIPDDQRDLQHSHKYLRELEEEDSSVLIQQPANCKHLHYLSDLINKPGQRDYADQITFPEDMSGAPRSAKAQLREVIRSCLHSRPEDRPTATQVHPEVYDNSTGHQLP